MDRAAIKKKFLCFVAINMSITLDNINEEFVKMISLHGKDVATKWFRQRLLELSIDVSVSEDDREVALAALKYFNEFNSSGKSSWCGMKMNRYGMNKAEVWEHGERTAQAMLKMDLSAAFSMLDSGQLRGTIAEAELQGIRLLLKSVTWHVYLLKCSDNTIYTGITNDIDERIRQHNEGKGAKYTRGRTPVVLIKSFEVGSKSQALKEEYRIKQLSRQQKLEL
jgi:putative endonuclease